MHEASLLYFEVQGNEWFFLQKIKDRQYDVLIAKIPAGVIGIGQTGDLLRTVEEMRRQRMMLFAAKLEAPCESHFQKLIDTGVLEPTLTAYLVRILQIEPGDAFEIERQGGRCFVISGLSLLEKRQMNTALQPRLLTEDRSRIFAVYGKDFSASEADFRKFTF